MVVELKLEFKDGYSAEGDDNIAFVHTLSAPEGLEITGGQIFVENPQTSELDRFSFRIDREEDGTAKLTILEDVSSEA